MESDNGSVVVPMAQTMFNANAGTQPIKMLGWNLPREHMDLLHPHWRSFEAPPFFAHLLLAVVYFILMIVSALGNGLVIYVFSTSKSLRTASNMFILNLAFFDFLMLSKMPHLIFNSFVQRMLGYDTGCTIYAAIGSLSGIGGAVTNAAIAFDRYKSISSPMGGRLSKQQAFCLILITWFWALPFTMFPILKIWGRYIPEGFLTTCSFDYLSPDHDTKVFVGAIFTWAYAIPISMIVIFYSKVYKHVKAHQNMLKEQAKKMNVASLQANKDSDSQSVEIRIAKAAFLIFFLFLCSWTPYAVVSMIGAFGDQTLLTPIATMIPALCAKTVSCLDPWVYAMSHPKYRQELERRFPWMGITEKNLATSNEAADTKTEVSQKE